MPTDSERLDWLENYVHMWGSLMLHDGSKSNFGSSGLGLAHRNLRDAIDTASGQKTNHQPTSVSQEKER